MKECVFQENELKTISLFSQIPWDSVLSVAPFLEEIGLNTSSLLKAPLSGTLAVRYFYEKEGSLEWGIEGSELLWKG